LNIKDNLDKITWSFLNRGIYLVWGIFNLVIIAFTSPTSYGLYFLITQIVTFLSSVSDSLSLQGIIQFSNEKKDRPKINLIAMGLQSIFLLIIPIILILFRYQFSELINEDSFVDIAFYLPIITLFFIPRTFAYKILARDLNYKTSFFIDVLNFGSMVLILSWFIFKNGNLSFENLIISYLISAILSGTLSLFIILKSNKFSFKGDFKIIKYLRFTVPWTIHSIFSASIKYLDVLVISFALYTEESLIIIAYYGSAKTLFKVFEQMSDGVSSLVYPSAIKHLKDKNKVKSIMTKSTSFVLVINLTIFLFLELGMADLIILNILPTKFHLALDYFKIMLIASLFIPFASLSMILTALNKIKNVVFISIIASISALLTIFIFSKTENLYLVSLGIVTYYGIIGILSLYFIKIYIGFPLLDLFRALPDTLNFYKSLKNK
jgi:O-antigen/teichoic acid export membrane protein